MPAVRLYGKTGTFYNLNGDTVLNTEQTFDQVAVTGWATRNGKSLGWSALTDGKVFISGQDMEGSPVNVTGTEMVASYFDPSVPSLTNIVIPTSNGTTSVVGSNGVTGGAALNDIEAVVVGAETYVAMVSTVPYSGWRISGGSGKGVYPSLAVLRKIAGTWQYDSAKSYTADQLHASSADGALAFPNIVNSFGETYAVTQGLAEIIQLPGTTILIGTQYFNDYRSTKAGSLVAIDVSNGLVKDYWEHPYTGSDPAVTDMGMRSIIVDSTATGTVKRFVVIFDCFQSGASSGFDVVQEFTYDTATNTIAPASVPVRTEIANRKWGNGVIDSDGNLWLAEEAAAFQAGDTCVFLGPRRTLTDTYGPLGSWWTPNALTGPAARPFPIAAPDVRLTPPSGTQIPWGRLLEDTATKTVFWNSLNAKVVAIHRVGTGWATTFTPLPQIDLDYKNQIESQEAVGVRGRLLPSDGSVDVAGRLAWLPIAQLDSSNTSTYPSAPHALDNWLYRFDLDSLLRMPLFGRSDAKEHWVATDVTPTFPPDWGVGDTMLIFLSMVGGGESKVIGDVAGWVKEADVVRVAGGFGDHVALFSRVMQSTTETPPTIAWTGGAVNMDWITAWYRGANPLRVVNAVANSVNSPATTSDRPSAIVTKAASRIVGFYGADGSVTFSGFSGEIYRRSDSGAGVGASALMTEEEALVGTGPTTARSVTLSASKQSIGLTVALAASPGLSQEGTLSEALRLRRYPMTFEKGLLQSLEDSAVPNGYAPRIENWVPTPAGGLRARQGWLNGGTSPAAPYVAGLAWQADYGQLVVIHDTLTASGYTVYKATALPSGALTSLGTIAGTMGVAVTMAMGQHTLAFGGTSLTKLYGVNSSGTLVDSGALAVPKNIVAMEYHHNAFYAGGGKDSGGTSVPYRLFYTDPGDGALGAWPANNYIDVGFAAGGVINCLKSFRDDLLIGKADSLWVLSGTPDDVLDLHALDIGNALPGESIVGTPYGAVICGYDTVFLFDGGSVQRIGRPIEGQYLGGNATTLTDAVYFEGRVYIANSVDNLVWVFDFDSGSWTVETGPSTVERAARLLTFTGSGESFLVAGTLAPSTAKALVYRQHQVPPEHSPDFTGWTETFNLRTPEYWLGGPIQRATVRYVDLQLRQRGTTGSGLTITPTVDGVAGTGSAIKTIAPNAAAGSFRTRVSFVKDGLTGYACQFAVTQAASPTHAIFDIEQAVVLYELEGAQA